MDLLARLLSNVIAISVTDGTEPAQRSTRRLFALASLFVAGVAPGWALLYATNDEVRAGAIPFTTPSSPSSASSA